MLNTLSAGDWGTWAGSIFTGLAFLGALYQIGEERKARKKQEQELREERKRAQALQISAWIAREDMSDFCWGACSNASNEPVFGVIVSLVAIQGGGPKNGQESQRYRSFVGVLPPGKFYTRVPWGGHGMGMRFALEIAFTDAAGNNWIRTGQGKIEPINKSPFEYYGLCPPLPWEEVHIEALPAPQPKP